MINHIKIIDQHYKTKKVSSNNVGINCPFCAMSDKGYNLWISIAIPKGYKRPQYHCWKCGSGGAINKFFKLLNISIDDEDLSYYDNNSSLSIYDELTEELYSDIIELPKEYIQVSKDTKSVIGKKVLAYLINRGIDYDKIDRYKLGYCCTGRYANRIIIPMYDEYDRLVFYVGRDFCNSSLKMLNPSKEEVGIGKVEILYNINNNIDKDTVIINEGPFDAMTTDGVALLGKIPSEIQINKIKKLKAENIIIMLDSDAIEYNYLMAEHLYNYKNVYICELKSGDPNSLSNFELEEVLSNKITYSPYSHMKFKLNRGSYGYR